jgi:hypothetical protein
MMLAIAPEHAAGSAGALQTDPLQDRNAQLAETTAQLQEEKLQLDALLVRQYNLVAVLRQVHAPAVSFMLCRTAMRSSQKQPPSCRKTAAA